MRDRFETWMRNLWIWLVPLVVLGINVLLWVVYETSFANRRASLESISERAGVRLEGLERQRAEMESFLGEVGRQKAAIDSIYAEHFATEGERFTRLLREVRQLARQAGLAPESFTYPKEELEDEGLVRRSITFSVFGNYEQVRRLINFFELSDQFITLEAIQLSGDAGTDRLSIRLIFSSLFVATDEDELVAAALEAANRPQREPAAEEADETASEASADATEEEK